MKLLAFLSKPRWQSKDPAIRGAAVATDTDAELVASLGRIAREDTDARVRLAAMRRLADPGIVQGLARDDGDAEVRRQARALWFDLLTGTHAASPPLESRLRLLKAQDDSDLIEHIARKAREPELRRQALDKSTRVGLLFERALEDADPALRLAAVERIDDEAQLLRLAERARKTDKQVSRRAKERVEAQRLTRGDGASVDLRARALCERMEQLIRQPETEAVEATIVAHWAEIEERAGATFRARFEAAQRLIAASRVERKPLPPVEATSVDRASSIGTEENVVAEPTSVEGERVAEGSDPASDAAVDPPLAGGLEVEDAEGMVAPLMAQARFAGSLDSAGSEQRVERERQAALVEGIVTSVDAFEAAIESGVIAQAHAAKGLIDGQRRQLRANLPRSLAQRLVDLDKRYGELSQWQHWADDQRRQQLCEDIENLAVAGLHPDAVATRVREAQTEWTRLEVAEGRDGARSGGLAKRFHGACRDAMAPTRTYFSRRQELRKSHAEQIAGVLERVGTTDAADGNWAAVVALRREVVEALRALDGVEPRERKQLAQRAKLRLTELDARIATHDGDIERSKNALIAEAEALGQPNPPRSAVAAARDLQQRWQQTGNGKRSRDQAQWKAFRAAIDNVFGRLDAERNERSARDADQRIQAEEACAELEILASADSPDRGAIAQLEAVLASLQVRDDALLQRVRAAQAALQDASSRRQRNQRHARFDAWLSRYAICRAAETDNGAAEALAARWASAPTTDIGAAQLDLRFARAQSGDPASAGDADAFADLLTEVDCLSGTESAEADRERRRRLQLERLSARMRGAATVAPYDELAGILVRWSELGTTSLDDADERLDRAVRRALETLA